MEEDSVPLDPVALGVFGVLEHETNRVAQLLLQRLHASDVIEIAEAGWRLHLEVSAAARAAKAAHHAAEEAPEGTGGRRGPSRR